MSSDNSQNQVTVAEKDAIAQELSSARNAGNVILPFCEKRLPYGWSPGSQQVTFFDLSHYQAIEEYCPLDQIITVQCGIKLHSLQQFLIKNKQWLPVAYPDEQTSLLDLILTGNAGPTEIFAGGLHRHILGLSFVLSNGVIAKSGGKVVKNVSGYDLTRFLIGSYGHFAVPIKANLRLYALPEQTCTLFAISSNIGHLFKAARSISAQGISLAHIDLFDNRLLSEELSRLVTDKITMTAGQHYCLLAQIYGDQVTIEAERVVIKKLLTEASLGHAIFTESFEQNQLLTALTRVDACLSSSANYRCVVEIAIAGGDFMEICQNKDLISFPFLYRPGSSRLLFCLDSSRQQDEFLTHLNEYVKMNNKPLVVAYSDDAYMRRVINIHTGTVNGAEAIKAIKQRLKEQFDPDNLFNPFVDL